MPAVRELVVFITELNTSQPGGIYSLQEYSCERYYRYNKELLFRENTRDILETDPPAWDKSDCLPDLQQ